MTDAKHTPGPWAVGYLDQSGQRIVKQEHIEICTCWHHSVGSIEQEMEANARLIAAAPDLLEALEGLVKINEEHNAAMAVIMGRPANWKDTYLDKARAAILKAKREE